MRTTEIHCGEIGGDRDEFSLFRDVVDATPSEVTAFFDAFATAREGMRLQLEAESLNAAAADEYHACKSKGRDAVLFKWFEVFRDIYIAAKVAESERGLEVLKNPDNFATFTRSFEPLAMLSEFWFVDRSLASRRDFRDRVYAVRFAFERFLYARAGARAWGAFDWEMHRYVRERLCGRLRLGDERALKRLAAVALTAHAVASEELGVYVEEFKDVDLPLAGISNVRGQAKPLLKYFHYDRFTQLSYAREHEFAADVNFRGDHVEFEQRWIALAVISDFALKEADAHSTLACATRAVFESASRCMVRAKSNLSRKGCPRVHKALDELSKIFGSLDFAPVAQMSRSELLKKAGLNMKVSEAAEYLTRSGIVDAESFWSQALPVFDEMVALVNKNRDETIPKYTERQRKSAFKDARSALALVDRAINYSRPSELREIGRADFLRHFGAMLSGGNYLLQPGVVADVLLGDEEVPVGRMSVWSDIVGRSCELPQGLPFGEGERKAYKAWIVSMWTELAAKCPIEDRFEKEGAKGVVDFSKFDFKAISDSADKLWNHYFSANTACMERWVLSIARTLEIIEECDSRNYASWRFKNGFVWPCGENVRRLLRMRLLTEKQRLQKQGVWPRNLERMKSAFLARTPVTIDTVAPKTARYFVMLAVFARLMVETCEVYPGLWSNKEELFSFFMHILTATNDALDYPLPCHLDIFRDSYLRTARSRQRQRNAVDSIVDGRFGSEAERQILLMYLAGYLKRGENGGERLEAIMKEDSIVAYFGKSRMDFLSRSFGRKAD